MLPTLKCSQKDDRFSKIVTKNTRTSSVLMVDDDVVLSRGLIERMVGAWSQSNADDLLKRPIVGIENDARFVGNGEYLFPCSRIEGWIYLQATCWLPRLFNTKYSEQQRGNLVIGKTMLFSTQYLELYHRDETIVSFVERGHFCEDVLMNAVIKNMSGKEPIFVSQQRPLFKEMKNDVAVTVTRHILSERGGLSFRGVATFRGGWIRHRRECIGWSEKRFGPGLWK